MDEIEDIIFPEKMIDFTKEFVQQPFSNDKDFTVRYTELRKKYKLSPNKPLLRKIYNQLLINKDVVPNQSFIQYSLKRKCRSQSGVSNQTQEPVAPAVFSLFFYPCILPAPRSQVLNFLK